MKKIKRRYLAVVINHHKMKTNLSFFILSFFSINAWGQVPQALILPVGKTGATEAACQDQFAGTIFIDNFTGQSNDIDLDTIFLCFADQFDIVHNGDADLTGDPNPLTVPGVTYGFFDCPPTVSGPNLTSILGGPCLTLDPPPFNGIWVTGGGSFNGNTTFTNTGSLQNVFAAGGPIQLWFAPMTIDNFGIKHFEEDPVTNELGPCVHLNVDEAFSVVFLNEIELSNFIFTSDSSGCFGQLEVRGGLPEFDGSVYALESFHLISDPGIVGTVTGPPASHGGTMGLRFPGPGLYEITIEDGKSCAASMIVETEAGVECDSLVSSSGEIRQNLEAGKIEVGPNPAKLVAMCRVPAHFSLPFHFELYGFDGQLLRSGKRNVRQFEIPLHELPSGLLLMKARDPKGVLAFGKIIVDKT